MPISDRAGAAALGAAALLLAGCAEPPGVAGQGAHRPVQALRAIQVAQNDVTIAGPKGYCVDPRATREAQSGAFVLLGSCAVLERNAPAGDLRAVLTASVSQPGLPGRSPAPTELERFFRSAEGRAALSHDGDASSLTLTGLHARDGVLFLTLRDTSAGRPDRLADEAWRAVFALDDRIVSLSATSLAEAPLGETDLRRTLERFVEAVRAANGQRGRTA